MEQCIRADYPQLDAPPPGESVGSDLILAWFEELMQRSAHLVAHWMRVGFVHGVLNTDNLSILGETIAHWMRVGFVHGVMNTDNLSIIGDTIDYGPYGWLEDFDPDWTPNTTDAEGRRYAFGKQPAVVHWNLTRLASALVPLVGEVDALQAACDSWHERFEREWSGMFASKLGWPDLKDSERARVAGELFDLLQGAETDMTLFFRALADLDVEQASPSPEAVLQVLGPCHYQESELGPERVAALHA